MEEIIKEFLVDGIIYESEGTYIKTDIYFQFLESQKRKVGYLQDIDRLERQRDKLIAYNNDLAKIAEKAPDKIPLMSRSYGLATFLKDACVPNYSKPTDQHKHGYVVKSYTDSGDKIFRKLVPLEAKERNITEEEFYWNLVKCTKHYYATTDMPKTSIKYFSDNVWRAVYEEYFSNPFESEDTSKWDKLG